MQALATRRTTARPIRRTPREVRISCLATCSLRVGGGARGPLNHAIAPWEDSKPPAVSAALWADPRVVELRDACASNGFITSLAGGSLPKERFAGYVAQDKFFLEVCLLGRSPSVRVDMAPYT